ncbi:SDR family NAD(P)-dependent oxidoreductase [Geodermatophilus sabuli]|uniref:SDR family NAD(P)-dependent oxidoreductase n=1 Tax=Geodermatophilus sabuli TaxID=1564158 RepID=UPI00182B914F|nr:SDR family oxidoreductase [Geodermatophilus sabuli]MBB3082812.1 3-oxoacyl-[acyl-carrier protein] reductase [Geodermatophilus sabuli]
MTGGADGLGAAIVRAFADDAARVVVLDPRGEAAARLAGEVGGRALRVDLTDPVDTREQMEKAVAGLGGLDVLVTCAADQRYAPLLEMDPVDLGGTFPLPVQSMLVAVQAAACAMVGFRTPGDDCVGKIITVAGAGGPGSSGPAHHAAARASVVALTRAAAQELGPHGITVNCLCPGHVLPPAEAAARSRAEVAAWSAQSPLGRLGEPRDVARAAVFLASGDSDYLTGDALNVGGGMALH